MLQKSQDKLHMNAQGGVGKSVLLLKENQRERNKILNIDGFFDVHNIIFFYVSGD